MKENIKIIAKNKKANFNYEILGKLEAGISLKGSEIKSIRIGHVKLDNSYVSFSRLKNRLIPVVINLYIKEYLQASYENHDCFRERYLLLKKKEIKKMIIQKEQKRYSFIPLSIYLKEGKAKLTIGYGIGKKNYDKRRTLKEREIQKDMDRVKKKFILKK